MIQIYELIAWVIMCHNIFFKKVKDKKNITENEIKDNPDLQCYKEKQLDDFIINEDEYKIDFDKNPLFYFFCMIDTLEPIKILKEIENLKKVRVSVLDDKIEFNFNDLCLPLRKEYESKINDLYTWLIDVKKNKLNISIH